MPAPAGSDTANNAWFWLQNDAMVRRLPAAFYPRATRPCMTELYINGSTEEFRLDGFGSIPRGAMCHTVVTCFPGERRWQWRRASCSVACLAAQTGMCSMNLVCMPAPAAPLARLLCRMSSPHAPQRSHPLPLPSPQRLEQLQVLLHFRHALLVSVPAAPRGRRLASFADGAPQHSAVAANKLGCAHARQGGRKHDLALWDTPDTRATSPHTLLNMSTQLHMRIGGESAMLQVGWRWRDN